MSRLPRAIVDQVRDASDIVEVIGRHVRLTKRGNSWLGLCPFHQERTPSFNVVPNKGIYYCFGCQVGGDVFRFLMQIEGIPFVEAVKELAQAHGIVIPERELTPEERRALRQKAEWYEALEVAAGFYEAILWTRPEGAAAREYLVTRCITDANAKIARLGYAPDGWSTLLDFLRREGFDPHLVEEVGLIRPRRQGNGHYDTFRERLLFPIRDERSRIIGFGGRILQGEGPKYINTPETRFYQKSDVLYGFDLARQAIQQKDRIIVVEGYFDVLSLYQAGFGEAVATCGTALTPQHLEKIRRKTRNVVILLDADEAGSRAAERVLPMFLQAGLQPWRLQLPGAKDPDQLIREEGAHAMEAALARKEPLLEWVIDRRLEAAGKNSISKQRILEELAPSLKELPPPVWSTIASKLHLPENLVAEAIRRAPSPRTNEDAQHEPPRKPTWKPSRDLTHLLWLIIHRYDQVADILHQVDPVFLNDHLPLREPVIRLAAGEPLAGVISGIIDLEVQRILQIVGARADLYTADQAAIGMCEVLERLLGPKREEQLADFQRQANYALGIQDFVAYRRFAQESQRLLQAKQAIPIALQKRDVSSYLQALQSSTVKMATDDAS